MRQLTVTHPSGAVGTFTARLTRHSRSLVWNECSFETENPYTDSANGPTIVTDNFALTTKTISGAGLTPATWTMAYASPSPSFGGDLGGVQDPPTDASDQKMATITNPDQTRTRYTFGIRYFVNEGEMLRTEMLSSTGVLLRDENNTYARNPVSPPYAVIAGNSGVAFADDFVDTYRVPRTQTVVSQNGDTFTSTVNSFDAYARPVSMTQSSSLGSSRSDTMAYYDDTTRWVLGQVRSVTNTNTGAVMMAMDFDAATALPIRVYQFGLLQMNLAYNADGTVASMRNALGQTTTLGSWKRGVPQLITNPDQTTRSAVVDNNGWVTSVTDERGSSTQYGYDRLGRSTSLTYPTADTVAWTGATMNYTQLTAAELGVPSGAWRVRMNQGNHQVSMYLDARYNPILSEDRDLRTYP
ncbi:MAG: RHS repeat protein [Nevskia sp.]|nr:RHS repeat protein [Nevskia sp.]